uniref:Protein CutA n=1 Tax=Steinernema glaseri TaxID=37863 RepID=A0A1I8AQ40_9BILA
MTFPINKAMKVSLLLLAVSSLLLLLVPRISTDQKMAASIVASVAARVVYVTVPSMEVARNISRSIVGGKLAACVNIVPGVTSIYEWENKIEESSELLLIIKTREEAIEELKKEVHRLHPYDVPEFISLPIEEGSEPYLKWVKDQTQFSPSSTGGGSL